jgi:curved DNA-binding protein CbpA
MRQNLYDLLGAGADDNTEDLRRAFLKAAKESHPDHHGDDPEAAARFREIAEAYDILRDPVQRAQYDRLIEVERRPFRSKFKGAFSHVKHHMVTDALIGAVLAVTLAGGYELYSRMSEPAAGDSARATAPDTAETAAVQPAEQERAGDRLAGRSAAQMPIVLPVAIPDQPAGAAPAQQTIEIATGNGGSADRTSAKADAAAAGRADEPQDRRDTLSAGVQMAQAPAADTGGTPESKPGRGMPEPVEAFPGIVKQPAVSAEAIIAFSARMHSAMKRPHFRHAALAHQRTVGRVHAQDCEGGAPRSFTSRY